MNPQIKVALAIYFLFPTVSGKETIEKNFNRDNVVVQFDPYVSILDKDNRHRYNDDDLLSLVSRVSTRFSRLLVHLTEIDLENDLNTSLAKSPLAIADYNRRFINSSKLEVWLAYRSSDPEALYKNHNFSYHGNPKLLIQSLHDLAYKANSIFNKTVTTILIPRNILLKLKSTPLPDEYKWGIFLPSLACEHYNYYINKTMHFVNVKGVKVVILEIRSIINDVLLGKSVQRLERTLETCEPIFRQHSLTKGFSISVPDTFTHEMADITRLVSSWRQLSKWSNDTGNTMILSKAFDTPYEQTVERKTGGWWRLTENPQYNSSKDFIFEEKAATAVKQENLKSYQWLRNDKQNDRNHVGIIMSVLASKAEDTEYPNEALSVLREMISSRFSKIVLPIQGHDPFITRILMVDANSLGALKKKAGNATEAILMIMPQVQIDLVFPENLTIEKVSFGIGIDKYMFSTYILPYIGERTLDQANSFKTNILTNLNPLKYKLGYAFNITTLLSSTNGNMENEEMAHITKILKDSESISIYFEEDDETVKLGATRMFQQRVVLLEEIKNILLKMHINQSTPVMFILIHYSPQPECGFHSNPWSLQNFVRYWDLMMDWATKTTTTIIFSNALDGMRAIESRKERVNELGWWRFEQKSGENGKRYQDNTRWIDKREEALRVSKQHFPEDTPFMKTEHIVLIVLLPFLVSVALIVLAFFLIRRYYQESYLTKSEIDHFFLGTESGGDEEDLESTQNEHVHKAAYDKSKYEVDAKSFKIHDSCALGAGEFGMVCRGHIEREPEGAVNVAIKTVNPEKIHKTTLNGLLSEIKVLAYLGKHVNIIELIGANTADLKHGKVFIFLELCQLGSLEKYLRKIRPIMHDDEHIKEKFNSGVKCNDKKVDRYLNLISLNKPVLDATLSEDLYRWSKEICNGMAYLASKHVVHADLATRNVLLNLRHEVKICDFGLSRRMYNYTSYVKQQQEPLPWRWMPPEALRLLQFNEKSDVWAYGVTLWEIYSLGDSPYPGISWDLNFAYMLEHGLRMSEPKYNEKDMYFMMKQCWSTNPNGRPTFVDLLESFTLPP